MQARDIRAEDIMAARRELARRSLAAEIHALAVGGLCERELGKLLRRLDEGGASDADRARLAGCTLETLRAVVGLCARI